jgi:hypothetical protein
VKTYIEVFPTARTRSAFGRPARRGSGRSGAEHRAGDRAGGAAPGKQTMARSTGRRCCVTSSRTRLTLAATTTASRTG